MISNSTPVLRLLSPNLTPSYTIQVKSCKSSGQYNPVVIPMPKVQEPEPMNATAGSEHLKAWAKNLLKPYAMSTDKQITLNICMIEPPTAVSPEAIKQHAPALLTDHNIKYAKTGCAMRCWDINHRESAISQNSRFSVLIKSIGPVHIRKTFAEFQDCIWGHHIASGISDNQGQVHMLDPVCNNKKDLSLAQWLDEYTMGNEITITIAPPHSHLYKEDLQTADSVDQKKIEKYAEYEAIYNRLVTETNPNNNTPIELEVFWKYKLSGTSGIHYSFNTLFTKKLREKGHYKLNQDKLILETDNEKQSMPLFQMKKNGQVSAMSKTEVEAYLTNQGIKSFVVSEPPCTFGEENQFKIIEQTL